MKVDRLSIISSSTVLPIEGTKSQMCFFSKLDIHSRNTLHCDTTLSQPLPFSDPIIAVNFARFPRAFALSVLRLACSLACQIILRRKCASVPCNYTAMGGLRDFSIIIASLSSTKLGADGIHFQTMTQLQIMIPINPVTCTYRPNGLVLSRSPSGRVRVRQDRNQTD